MTEESPKRPKRDYDGTHGVTANTELRALIAEWRRDADKIQQTVGVEPTTLIRCARDLEQVIDGE